MSVCYISIKVDVMENGKKKFESFFALLIEELNFHNNSI